MAGGVRRNIRPHHRKPGTRRQPVQSRDPVFTIVHNRPSSPGSDAWRPPAGTPNPAPPPTPSGNFG